MLGVLHNVYGREVNICVYAYNIHRVGGFAGIMKRGDVNVTRNLFMVRDSEDFLVLAVNVIRKIKIKIKRDIFEIVWADDDVHDDGSLFQ